MQGPWDDYGPSTPGAPGGLTRITPPKAPDPREDVKDARDARKDARDAEGSDRSEKGQIQDYRKEYDNSPAVRTYGIAIQSLSNAFRRGGDATGDAALIYDWAKAMDPESVVRESEVGLAQTGQSMIESAAARMKKELSYQEGGLLDPQNRERLRREIFNATMSRLHSYNQKRDFFADLSRRGKYNPEDVIGPHLGEPFREQLSKYNQQGGLKEPPVVSPGAAPTEMLLNPADGEREDVDDSVLEAGQKFAYDASGQRIGILNADGTWAGGYGSIVDDATGRAAEEKIKKALGDEKISMKPGIDKGAMWNWSDEYRGLEGGMQSLVTDGNFGKGYRETRDLERAAQRLSRKEHGILPEIGGSLATAIVPFGAPVSAAKMMGQGAAIGAIAGAGEGEGFQDTVYRTALGSGVGAVAGGVLSQAPKLASRLTRNRPVPDQAIVQAGERQGIPIRLPDAMPSKSREFAVLESSPNVGNRIHDTLKADVEAFGNRVGGLAAPGRGLEALPRGDMIQKAGGRFLARTRQKASDLYNQAKAVGGDEVVDAAPFIQNVDDRIAQLKANGEEANGGVISLLESMKRDLSNGLSVSKLQAQRTTLRSRLNSAGLTMDPNQAQLSDALSVAADVLKGGLSKPGARDALNAADAFYADRQKFIGGVLKHFSDRKGNIGPETAAKRFDQFLKEGGNFRVVQKMFGELEPDEKASIAASVAQSLGRDRKGEFSLPIFLNNVSGKSATLSSRAKFLLFGRDGVRSLRDLELIAKAKTAAESGFNRSRSNTTAQGGFRLKDSLLSLLGLTGAAGAGGDAATTLVAGAAAYGASRGISKLSDARKASLMLNPKFTSWLRNAPDTDDPAVINKYLDQLSKIASREQAFLMDANAIRSFVSEQLSKSPGRAAADDQTGERRRGPPSQK